MRTLTFLCLLSSCYCWELGWEQSTGVKGKLLCNRKPVNDARIWIFEREPLNTVRLINKQPAKPGKFGKFKIEGTATEVTEIDPYIMVIHWCTWNKERTKFCIDIPSKYINKGRKVKTYYYLALELTEERVIQKKCP
ncbi:unnamed protein product [Cylicocyclus nassatus]|uniref:Uncharacterized protein n=1 Tax=Cylicocyclus nassatus TaxID=53992 RepID=A0AA36H9Q1_CYLNA|nr:unnamed protein product [Cylicocyclus nassatus]